MSEIQDEKLAIEFVLIARKYRLNACTLHMVLMYRIYGLNNLAISRVTGCSRNTINRYVVAMKNMARDDIHRLVTILCSTWN